IHSVALLSSGRTARGSRGRSSRRDVVDCRHYPWPWCATALLTECTPRMMQLPSKSDESGGADTAGSEFPDTLAAGDLGSNSFHMVVAVPSMAGIKVVDRLREPVRLGAGLRPDGILSEDAQQRALVCLRRFGQRLRQMPPQAVRVVGTNT